MQTDRFDILNIPCRCGNGIFKAWYWSTDWRGRFEQQILCGDCSKKYSLMAVGFKDVRLWPHGAKEWIQLMEKTDDR